MSQVRAGCCQPDSSKRRWLHRWFYFSCAGRKKQGWGEAFERDGLKTHRNKASERYIYAISCLGASSESQSPYSSIRQHASAGCSFAWRSRRPFQHLYRPPSGTKNVCPCPLTAPFFNIQCCEDLCCRRGQRNGKYWVLLHAGDWCPEKNRWQQPRQRALP